MNKYHNIRAGGFDSRKEARRWQELQLMERAGVISELRRQVKYEIIPAHREPDIIGPRGGRKPGPVTERAAYYIADFVYIRDGRQVVEDCKGKRTPDYILKRKLMLEKHGIKILET